MRYNLVIVYMCKVTITIAISNIAVAHFCVMFILIMMCTLFYDPSRNVIFLFI